MRAKRRYLGLFAALALVAIATASAVATAHDWNDEGEDNSREIKRLIDSDKPKNVILLVGDGMGDSEITLARYYGKGRGGHAEHGDAAVRRRADHLRPLGRPRPDLPA